MKQLWQIKIVNAQRLYIRASCEYNTMKGELASSAAAINPAWDELNSIEAHHNIAPIAPTPKMADSDRIAVIESPKAETQICPIK
jgi:hypothetical protein